MTPGKVGKALDVTDVEQVTPVGTWTEKRLRYEWAHRPSARFLMNWNAYEAPNQMFLEDLNETGLTLTVRWALMKETPDQLAARLNRWLDECENLTFRKSGGGGRRLQPT